MYPVAYCNGEDSTEGFNSILYAPHKSMLDMGSKAILNGEGSKAEMISPSISHEGSKMIIRGYRRLKLRLQTTLGI